MISGYWKPDEIERFEWALNQHGKDYKMITEHVKTRSLFAITNRFNHHVKDKSAYALHKRFWTADERQKFADAVRQFGDNRKKISEFVGSKSVKKVYFRLKWIQKHEDITDARVFKVIRKRTCTPWDDDERRKLIEAVKKYGKNPRLISMHVGTRDYQ